MPRIKTREVAERGIKTIDRAAIASERMRGTLGRSRDSASSLMDDSSESPSAYAADRFQDGVETAIEDGAHGAYDVARGTLRAGRRGYEYYREKTAPKREKREADRAKRAAEAAKREAETARREAEAAKQDAKVVRKKADQDGTKVSKKAADKAEQAAHRAEKTAQRAEKTAQRATEKAEEAAQRVTDRAKSAVNKSKRAIKQSVQSQRRAIKTTQKSIKTAQKTVKTAQKAAKTAVKTTEATAKTAKETVKLSVKAGKAAVWMGRMAVKAAILAGKAVAAGVKAAVAAVKSLVAAIAAGGWVAVLIIVIICVIALVIACCFSIFLPQENGVPPSQNLNQVIMEINTNYHYDIDHALGAYVTDMAIISGSRVNWQEVLVVYACILNPDPNNPQEVVSMSDSRKQLLSEIFAKMNAISTHVAEEERTFIELETDKDGNVVEKEVFKKGKVLYVTISHKSLAEMAAEYSFNQYQQEQMEFLLLPESVVMWDPFLQGIEQY